MWVTTRRECTRSSVARCQNEPMRVVVATDRIGDLSSADVGAALATGWQNVAPRTELAVVPMGESGGGFAQASADLMAVEPTLLAVEDAEVTGVINVAADRSTLVIAAAGRPPSRWIPEGSSAELGRVIARAVRQHDPRRLVIDVGGMGCHDAGAGLLHGLGARADAALDAGAGALEAVTDVDLAPVRLLLQNVHQITVVVPAAEAAIPLLGLRGITSRRGSEHGVDSSTMLATDAALERFVGAVAPEAGALPGAGACGVSYALMALGAELVTGPAWCAERVDLGTTLSMADVVLTGAEMFDFASRGGDVVQYLAEVSAEKMRPCIAAASTVLIGAREMRSMGIEGAYSISQDGPPGPVAVQDLVRLGQRIARTWDRD